MGTEGAPSAEAPKKMITAFLENGTGPKQVELEKIDVDIYGNPIAYVKVGDVRHSCSFHDGKWIKETN